jgi:hypothetical protein
MLRNISNQDAFFMYGKDREDGERKMLETGLQYERKKGKVSSMAAPFLPLKKGQAFILLMPNFTK